MAGLDSAAHMRLFPGETIRAANACSIRALKYIDTFTRNGIIKRGLLFDETGHLGIMPQIQDAIEYLREAPSSVAAFRFANACSEEGSSLLPSIKGYKREFGLNGYKGAMVNDYIGGITNVHICEINEEELVDTHRSGLYEVLAEGKAFVETVEDLARIFGSVDNIRVESAVIDEEEMSRDANMYCDFIQSHLDVSNEMLERNFNAAKRKITAALAMLNRYIQAHISEKPGAFVAILDKADQIRDEAEEILRRLENDPEKYFREILSNIPPVDSDSMRIFLEMASGMNIRVVPGSIYEDKKLYGNRLTVDSNIGEYPWDFEVNLRIFDRTFKRGGVRLNLSGVPLVLRNTDTNQKYISHLTSMEFPGIFRGFHATFSGIVSGYEYEIGACGSLDDYLNGII